MRIDKLRNNQDIKLYSELIKSPVTKHVISMLEEHEKKVPQHATRKHLLSSSVRLSQGMFPDLGKMKDKCIDKLEIDIPVELFVYPSPQFNAACFKPENNILYIMFSSSLLESFQGRELEFVLGHELGHYLFDHHQIPTGLLAKEKISQSYALKLFQWSRYAEISADRAGAYCAGDFASIGKAMFKLSSGISNSDLIKFDLESFLDQAEDLESVRDSKAINFDWFTSHPFSPLRLKALNYFFASNLMKKSGTTLEELEMKVDETLDIMNPSYLKSSGKEAVLMRDFLMAASIVLAHVDGNFCRAERLEFAKLFTSVDVHKINRDVLEKLLPERIKNLKNGVSLSKRVQVMRDLLIIARADNKIVESEKKFLNKVCSGLGVDPGFLNYDLIGQDLD